MLTKTRGWGYTRNHTQINYIRTNKENKIIQHIYHYTGNMKQIIKRILREYTKDTGVNIDEVVKDKILNGTDFEDWIEAVKLKYGEVVPLYHATTKENSEIIDKEGLKLTYGKNYKSFSEEPILYFQLGQSDYSSTDRSVVYRLDVPINFLNNVDIDMDNPELSQDKIGEYIDIYTWVDLPSDIRDAIFYFIWNNLRLDGTELIVRSETLDQDIFKGTKLTKVNTNIGIIHLGECETINPTPILFH